MNENKKKSRKSRKGKGKLKIPELNILHRAAKIRHLDKSFNFSKRALNKVKLGKTNRRSIFNLYKNVRKTLKKVGKTLKRKSM